MSSMMAIINPGDEVVVFEPFYENYGPDAILSGRHAAIRDICSRRIGRSIPTNWPRPLARDQGDHSQYAE